MAKKLRILVLFIDTPGTPNSEWFRTKEFVQVDGLPKTFTRRLHTCRTERETPGASCCSGSLYGAVALTDFDDLKYGNKGSSQAIKSWSYEKAIQCWQSSTCCRLVTKWQLRNCAEGESRTQAGDCVFTDATDGVGERPQQLQTRPWQGECGEQVPHLGFEKDCEIKPIYAQRLERSAPKHLCTSNQSTNLRDSRVSLGKAEKATPFYVLDDDDDHLNPKLQIPRQSVCTLSPNVPYNNFHFHSLYICTTTSFKKNTSYLQSDTPVV